MHKPEIIIISALAESNRVIGNEGKVPWHIPKDSARFHQVTCPHPVIMGRKTWEHDVECIPLPNRKNIVVSSEASQLEAERPSFYTHEELVFVSSLEAALQLCEHEEKIFVVGGATLYAQALDVADTLDLTLVQGTFEGDTFFPEYRSRIGTEFILTSQEIHPGFRFVTYKRVEAPRSRWSEKSDAVVSAA